MTCSTPSYVPQTPPVKLQRSFCDWSWSIKCSQCLNWRLKESYASKSIHIFQLISLNLNAAVRGKFAELAGGPSPVTVDWTNKLGCIRVTLKEPAGRGRGCCSQCGGEWMMPGASCIDHTTQTASLHLNGFFPSISVLTFSLFTWLNVSIQALLFTVLSLPLLLPPNVFKFCLNSELELSKYSYQKSQCLV